MSQSKGVITTPQQLAYLAQWFAEMSELQTQDFMKCLLNKYAKSGHQVDGQLVNGISLLGVSDRPASIFQCRMKLFNEWFGQWSDEEKQELLVRLRNVNSKFMDQFQVNLESGPTANGCAITDDDYSHTLNGNIDDDSKTSEQLVLNGVDTELSPEPVESPIEEVVEETVPVEEESKLEAEQHEEQTVEAQEVVVVDVAKDVEEAVVEEKVNISEDLIVNGTDIKPSELQEVVG